ncbi:MAG: [NiFe]-hydrogenase assembly chaperone HybE [Thiohalomonadaceae bacterium]
MNTAWQLPPPALLEDDGRLTAAVETAFAELYREVLCDEPTVNHGLPIVTRAFRSIGPWRVFLLLTPWMLARVLIPAEPPALDLPEDWHVSRRAGAAPVVLGPLLTFSLLETPQRAHLNHHPAFGHYLLQPLILAMENYRDADAVFAAWNEVLRTRDENMKRLARDCPMQRELSRREFFRGVFAARGD